MRVVIDMQGAQSESRFRAGMQNGQTLKLVTLPHKGQHALIGLLGRPHRADGFDLAICQFDDRLDAQQAPQ